MNLYGESKGNTNHIGEFSWNDLMIQEDAESINKSEAELLKLFERNIIITPKKSHNEQIVTFNDFKSNAGKLGKFRMDLQVFDVQPDVGDFSKLFCKSCQSTYL